MPECCYFKLAKETKQILKRTRSNMSFGLQTTTEEIIRNRTAASGEEKVLIRFVSLKILDKLTN